MSFNHDIFTDGTQVLKEALEAHPGNPELLRMKLSLTALGTGLGSQELDAAKREATDALSPPRQPLASGLPVASQLESEGSRQGLPVEAGGLHQDGCPEYRLCLSLTSVEPTWQGTMGILQRGVSRATGSRGAIGSCFDGVIHSRL